VLFLRKTLIISPAAPKSKTTPKTRGIILAFELLFGGGENGGAAGAPGANAGDVEAPGKTTVWGVEAVRLGNEFESIAGN
jgi:hypothetical protein